MHRIHSYWVTTPAAVICLELDHVVLGFFFSFLVYVWERVCPAMNPGYSWMYYVTQLTWSSPCFIYPSECCDYRHESLPRLVMFKFIPRFLYLLFFHFISCTGISVCMYILGLELWRTMSTTWVLGTKLESSERRSSNAEPSLQPLKIDILKCVCVTMKTRWGLPGSGGTGIVSCLIQMLGIKPGFSRRGVGTLKCWVVNLAHKTVFYCVSMANLELYM